MQINCVSLDDVFIFVIYGLSKFAYYWISSAEECTSKREQNSVVPAGCYADICAEIATSCCNSAPMKQIQQNKYNNEVQ